jgi:hypothetical protein
MSGGNEFLIAVGGAIVGGLFTMYGSVYVANRETRRRALTDLHLDRIPATDRALRLVFDDPTDDATLQALEDAAADMMRVAALVRRRNTYDDAMQVWTDCMDFRAAIGLATEGRTVYAGQPIPLSPDEIARRERWHLDQAQDVLWDVHDGVAEALVPSRSPRAILRRIRTRVRRANMRRKWRRDFHKRIKADEKARAEGEGEGEGAEVERELHVSS